MNKSGSPLQTPTFVMDYSSHLDHEPARRLIVLIPSNTNYRSAMQRILDLAMASGADVLFLGLCKDPADGLGLRRELITASALFQNVGICVEANVETGPNWIDIVKSKCHTGDTIVCFSEPDAEARQQSLHQILESDLRMPVYVLSDVNQRSAVHSNWLSEIVAWTGFITIIAGSFLLQIQIKPMSGDWGQTILLILSVIAEIWLIRVWNGWFR